MNTPLVEVRGLVKHFPLPSTGTLRRERPVVHALNGVDLDVERGQFIALVGESGSGKTTLANCIAGFEDPTEGSIAFDGKPLVDVSVNGHRKVRHHRSRSEVARDIQMVFQDPSSALNPRQSIGSILAEPLIVHGVTDRKGAEARVSELFELTGIASTMRRRFPHELNSGQRQRVVIARSLALSPSLVVADEAVSRLDVSMQSQILNLLLSLHRDLGLTIVFITHDLSVVRQVADTVIVMYLGRIMEACSADAFFARPLHPYSSALVQATPRFLTEGEELFTLSGEIPSPVNLPAGCPFHTRCPIGSEECTKVVPEALERAPGHLVACIKA
jgi:oligopeptide transport system ATP-binding protein